MRRVFLSLAILAASVMTVGLMASSAQAATPGIVSIGDSVTAGAGLPAANGEQNQLCERSRQAYPYAVARELGESLLHIPCFSAKVDEGVYGTQTRIGSNTDVNKSPQLDRAFARGIPDYIIGTVGANDMRWVEYIQKCYVRSCGSYSDSAATALLRTDLRYELSRMVYEIRNHSDGDTPQIYLGGYYLPFSDASCVESPTVSGEITASEQRWIASQTAKLNQAIKSVADVFPGVEFVPVDFSGHGVCDDAPWVQDLSDDAPLHPNAEGQAAYARAFLSKIRSQD